MKNRKMLWILPVCIVVIAAVTALWWFLGADGRQYDQARQLYEQGDYVQAQTLFAQLGDYGDAPTWVLDARYAQADSLLNAEDHAGAAELFLALDNHRDSREKYSKCCYELGCDARLAQDFALARDWFGKAGDYRDAAAQQSRMIYNLGHNAFLEGDFATADAHFDQLGDSWPLNTYPHFEKLTDAMDYVRERYPQLPDQVVIHVAEEPDDEFYNAIKNLLPNFRCAPTYYKPEKKLTIAGIYYYPGDVILHAYRNGTTDSLTDDEKQVLETVLEVVETAKRETEDPVALQQYIHDWICQRITYQSPNMDVRLKDYLKLRELSCIGAVLDGTANCQGYADTFYLMGNLADLQVDRVFGDTGGGHVWNAVTIDGVRYITDTTFDDTEVENLWTYTFFNIYWDPDVYSIYGGEGASQGLTTQPNMPHSYYDRNGLRFQTSQAAAEAAVEEFLNGATCSYVLVENATVSLARFCQLLQELLEAQSKMPSVGRVWINNYGGNSCFTIQW